MRTNLSINELWTIGTLLEWKYYEAKYDVALKNMDERRFNLEQEILEADISKFSSISRNKLKASSWVEFINKYLFDWVGNQQRFKEQPKDLFNKFIFIEEQGKKFNSDLEKLFALKDYSNIRECFKLLTGERGVSNGILNTVASAFLSLIRPEHFATLSYPIYGLINQTRPKNKQINFPKTSGISLYIKQAEQGTRYLRDHAEDMNHKFETKLFTPRYLDRVLYAFARKRYWD